MNPGFPISNTEIGKPSLIHNVIKRIKWNNGCGLLWKVNIKWFLSHTLLSCNRSVSQIQGKKSIYCWCPHFTHVLFPTHLHCCINRVKWYSINKYRGLLTNLIFKGEIITFLNCQVLLGGRDRGQKIAIWCLSCQNLGKKIKHVYILWISYCIF